MSYDSVILSDNPVAYWKLEELAPQGIFPNSNCADSGPNGFAGALIPNADGLVQGLAGPILTDGVSYGMRGPVARIPGTGSAIGALDPLDAQTWECWAQTTSTGCEMMMNRGGDTTTNYLSFGQRATGLYADSAVFVLDFGLDGGRILISCPLAQNAWHHVAVVRDGSFMGMYIDSWLVTSRNDLPLGPINIGSFPWRLGYTTNLVFVRVDLSFGISHAAAYDYALSQPTLESHVIAALGSLPPNPCGETPAIEVSCPTTVEGVVGEPYSAEVAVAGGTPPYTFAIIAGTLPDGLTLDTVTGIISGTPTTAGVFNFTIQVTDSEALTGTSPGCGIIIDEVPPPVITPHVTTEKFGSGEGSAWWLIPHISDSGNELRPKNIKALRITGRVTNCSGIGYAFDVGQGIDVAAMEAGERINTKSVTRPQEFPDTTEVTQSARKPINIVGVLHTCRIEGDGTGNAVRDRLDEIVYEQDIQGVRR